MDLDRRMPPRTGLAHASRRKVRKGSGRPPSPGLDVRPGRLLAWGPMALMIQGEEYLTVEEAAELMGVKPATLYAYVSRGILRSYRQGMKRQRLYRRADIDDLIRVVPSASVAAGARALPEIPLAESWIRD